MNLLEADSRLRKIGQPCFATREAAAYLNVTTVYASTILRRLAAAHRIVRLRRGRWLIGEGIDPFVVPEALTAPTPTYISLQSALYYHGMISQIPAVTYAVSLTRTTRYKNAAGEFSLHHVAPEFFCGFELIGRSMIKMATPEKALIDYLYLSLGRSRQFRALPELELPRSFSRKKALAFIARLPTRAKQSAVRTRFEQIMGTVGGG